MADDVDAVVSGLRKLVDDGSKVTAAQKKAIEQSVGRLTLQAEDDEIVEEATFHRSG